MSEFAIVSAKRTRLQQRAENGDTGAPVLALAKRAEPILSTIWNGITLAGIFAGALGGLTVAEGVAMNFTTFPAIASNAAALDITLIVLVI